MTITLLNTSPGMLLLLRAGGCVVDKTNKIANLHTAQSRGFLINQIWK